MATERLDKLLIKRGIVASRPRAERLISTFGVRVNGGDVVTKPAKQIPIDATLEPLGEDMPWVGRGAYKLLEMIRVWPAFADQIQDGFVLDVGASTGGFTEVCLQHGAAGVCALDAGRDQLHPSLRTHPKVCVVEQRKVQDFDLSQLVAVGGRAADAFAVDVSFTSLRHILPALPPLLQPGALGCLLVKPQFEVGPAGLSRAGVVRNEKLRLRTIRSVTDAVRAAGFDVRIETPSPIAGGDGNIEHLLGVCNHIPSRESSST